MTFFNNAKIYLISNILNAAIPFFLLPIFTRYLTPTEYGQIAIFQTLISAISTFIGLNTVGAANRKFYDDETESKELKEFNGACVYILLFSSLIVFILIFLFKHQLNYFLSIPIDWIIYSVIVCMFNFITSLRLGQWQIRNQAKPYGFLQISTSVLNVIFSLVLVVNFNYGAKGRVDSLMIVSFIACIYSISLLYKDNLLTLRKINFNFIIDALKFGIPLVPHILGFFLIASVDRFIINDKLGLNEAGIYMVAFQLSSVFALTFDAINKSYIPWLFDILKKNDSSEKNKVVKNTYIYFILLLFVATISFFFSPLIINIVLKESYSSASNLIGWLCLGQIFGGMYLMVTNYVFYAKETLKLSMITISTGILNVILLFVFLNVFGLVGAAMSFALTKFVQFLATWILAAKCVKMNWV